MCCSQIENCMQDATCTATVVCQYNCYDTETGTAADTCAAACAGQSGALFLAYDTCNGTTCETPCECP
jgi:hypothetical protein